MDGYCDVKGCTNETYMGWRPLTERLGKQICEGHWLRHKDPADSFNLFDAFGFRRPAAIRKPMPKKDIPPRAPEPDPGRTLCMQLAAKPEPAQEKPDCQEPPKPGPQTERIQDKGPVCKDCGGKRETRHTYCDKCSRERKRHTHQERQRRYRQRRAQAVKT